ncbi:conserved hypothetical protein [Cupriavidus taiwanensis]|uniref:hypothetical protein n=1 Tax=Cupriavidus taiwanensis TaxID=164546 RepID=UPI000E16DAB5|nr:hypothetical protein [Cupriavidus taiwanensis]SOY93390.1 conserved hypothetical protein [Cupriavidus taiwanensis]SOY96362.1 conserved hypothetical protein [Cupriavidus taiwanensis]
MTEWREAIASCGDEPLAAALIASIEDLFANDMHSLTVDASERHVAALLAEHLGRRAPVAPDGRPWQVHVEYNRNGVAVKTIEGIQVVVPDIIMHRAGTTKNYLAVELKKGDSDVPDEGDVRKLRAYKRPDELGYTHTLFLRLGIGERAGTVTCVAWC